jgi:predicted DNA-binding ribbon-helix-helix protein
MRNIILRMQWVKNRRIGIHGRQTSLRLEPEFWFWLRLIAAETGTSATKFIESINIARNPDRTLSASLRVAIAGYFYNAASHADFVVDRESRFAFQIEKKPRRKVPGAAPAP